MEPRIVNDMIHVIELGQHAIENGAETDFAQSLIDEVEERVFSGRSLDCDAYRELNKLAR
jgi:hypothetical protein